MNIIKSKNIFLYVSIIIIVLFTVLYFVLANKASYAFEYNESDYLYDGKIKLILKSATLYGRNNVDLFKKGDSIYITVDDLVKNGYLVADENGKILDPRSSVKNLNDLKIRLSLQDDTVDVKLLEK